MSLWLFDGVYIHIYTNTKWYEIYWDLCWDEIDMRCAPNVCGLSSFGVWKRRTTRCVLNENKRRATMRKESAQICTTTSKCVRKAKPNYPLGKSASFEGPLFRVRVRRMLCGCICLYCITMRLCELVGIRNVFIVEENSI